MSGKIVIKKSGGIVTATKSKGQTSLVKPGGYMLGKTEDNDFRKLFYGMARGPGFFLYLTYPEYSEADF